MSLSDLLASYVPAPVSRRIALDPSPIREPRVRRYEAAAIFADITGFTQLTERIGQRGIVGVEAISDLLNAYFGRLLATVDEHGGDVTGFAGDALFAIWPSDETGSITAVLRATACALDLQHRLHDYDGGDGVRLALRIGVGVGDAIEMEVGGEQGRWQYVLAGALVVQVAVAEAAASPGEVVISPDAAALLAESVDGSARSDGCMAVRTLRHAPIPRAAVRPVFSPAASDALRAFVPEAILSRLDAGQNDWLAELRPVTVAFVGVGGIDLETADALGRLHAAVGELQATIDRFEGSLLRLGVDDKGTRLLVGFGVPPRAHEDDPARALHAALAIRDVLRSRGIVPAIGLATGRAFCGAIGAADRGEYTVIGDVANLAARLMQAADGDVLCDEATHRAARGQITFEALPAMTVKGKAQPVPVFRPIGRAEGASARTGSTLVGRTEERALLGAALDDLIGGQIERGRVVVLEAEAGLGKSRLVQDLIERAAPIGATGRLRTVIGTAEAIDQSTAYYPWRTIVRTLIDLRPDLEIADQRARVLAALATLPEVERFAPLVNAVLPLAIPENDVTEFMTGDVRGHNTRAVLTALIGRAAHTTPLLLVVEDAHWCDSASWALMLDVARLPGPILLVIALRPLTDPIPSAYVSVLDAPDTRLFQLAAMSPEEALAIVRARLGVSSLPEPVAELIAGRAQGNPFFSEELAYALRDAGHIEIEGTECRLAAGADLAALNFPDTVQGVIVSRIDRLSPQQQFTLKIASVIGRVFASRIVRDVYPIEADRRQLADHLMSLVNLDLTPMETPLPDDTYAFKHVITQEVAYNLMLFAQRRELHRRTAEWFEGQFADNLEPYYPLLAHHWGRAEIVPRTIEYLDKAGEQAIRQGTYREAIGFFAAALDLDARSEGRGDRFRRSRWEAALAEAHHGLTQLPEARLHYERSLALLGEPPPRTRVGWAMLLVRSVARQALHLARPSVVARRRRLDPRAGHLAETYAKLAFVYYHQNDKLTSITTSVRGLNLAELGGPERVIARLSSNMCIAAALIPNEPLAGRYGRRGFEAASAAGDLYALALASMSLAWVQLGFGKWESAQREVDRAVELYRRIGELRLLDECLMVQAVSRRTGPLEPLVGMWDAVYQSARHRGDAEVQAWALALGSWSLLARDRLDETFDRLRRSDALLGDHSSRTGFIKLYGLLGVAHLRADEPALAARAAETAYRSISAATPILVSTFDGYAGCAETYLTLWERGDGQYRRQAWQALDKLEGLARVFPICRPRAWLFRGLAAAAEGKLDRANGAWRRSVALAEQLAMPYEGARARYEIARHLPDRDPMRAEHLREASRVFDNVGAHYDLRLARAAS